MIIVKWYADEILLLIKALFRFPNRSQETETCLHSPPPILVPQDGPRWIMDEQLLEVRLHAHVFIQPVCIFHYFHTAVNIHSLDKFVSCVHI